MFNPISSSTSYSSSTNLDKENSVPVTTTFHRVEKDNSLPEMKKRKSLAEKKVIYKSKKSRVVQESDKASTSEASSSRPARAPLERKYPRVGLKDTSISQGSTLISCHGQGSFFYDDEIIKVFEPIKTSVYSDVKGATVNFHKGESGKFVLQQQATRGCTAAAAGMLMLDHGKPLNISNLRRRNLGQTDRIVSDLKEVGLRAVLLPIKGNMLEFLSHALKKNGSAIISLTDNKLGNHVVVLDEIDLDKGAVRLRDPYHGWEIEVTVEAFSSRNQSHEIVQII